MESEIDTSLLPGILREMVELIGVSATLILVARYGGVRLYVPINATGEHPIADLIGVDNLARLMTVFGGETLEIPKALLANVAQRNIAIKQEYKYLSQRQLALKYNLTERQVRNILCGDGQDDNQMGLF